MAPCTEGNKHAPAPARSPARWPAPRPAARGPGTGTSSSAPLPHSGSPSPAPPAVSILQVSAQSMQCGTVSIVLFTCLMPVDLQTLWSAAQRCAKCHLLQALPSSAAVCMVLLASSCYTVHVPCQDAHSAEARLHAISAHACSACLQVRPQRVQVDFPPHAHHLAGDRLLSLALRRVRLLILLWVLPRPPAKYLHHQPSKSICPPPVRRWLVTAQRTEHAASILHDRAAWGNGAGAAVVLRPDDLFAIQVHLSGSVPSGSSTSSSTSTTSSYSTSGTRICRSKISGRACDQGTCSCRMTALAAPVLHRAPAQQMLQ
jgi:hypothetical protein